MNLNLKSKSVLVTGGAGFIGSHLVDSLFKEGVKRIIVVDNFYLGKLDNLNSNVKVCPYDASSQPLMQEILSKYKIDVVFNLAVIPLPVSLIDPKFNFNKNVSITMSMCELLRLGCYETLIHFSSSEVYGSAKYIPMDESHALNGITPYAASKASCDLLVLSYCRTFGVDASIVRPFNAYGPRQNWGDYAGVIPLTMKRIIEGKPLVIQGRGKQTRDFSYVTDIVDAAIKIYKCKESRGKVINIGSGKETSIISIIGSLDPLNKLAIVYEQERAGDVNRHLADISLAKHLIDYSPKVGLSEGLDITRKWYMENYND